MDKYEYNIKSDQIKKLYSHKEFEAAAKIADEIDWYRVKDNTMISRVADIYENTKQYDKAKEVLLIAYERSPLGRQLAYKLTILALRTKNFVEADEFYQDFVEMSPSDVSQYLLKYRISKAKGEDIEVLIKILEAYIDVEMDERWQYELAKLYHEAGQDDKSIAMCDELELWFNDGKYVEKARELRKLIIGVLSEYTKRYASENNEEFSTSINKFDEENVKYSSEETEKEESEGSDSAENDDIAEIRSLAEAIVASKEARETAKFEDGESDETSDEESDEDLEPLDENISEEEYLDDEIKPEDEAKAAADAAAKEVARRAVEAEKNRYIPTPEEAAAAEALKAAETAALEAQKAADFARKLVMEAKFRAEQVKTSASGDSDRFKGMSAEEISRKLEEEDMLKGDADFNKKDSMIEIFEFDKSKEGKVSNIGDELTKTAEIDINEINVRLADEENLYNTANIQAALAKSMEKLLDDEKKKIRNAFEMQVDDEANEIRPAEVESEEDDSYLEDDIEKSEIAESAESTTETVEGTTPKAELSEDTTLEKTTLEETTSEDTTVEETTSEETTSEDTTLEETVETINNPTVEVTADTKEEPIKEEQPVETENIESQEESEDFYLDDDEFAGEPTKRIDRAEINRILNASKNIYQTVPLSPLFDQEEDGQIGLTQPEEEAEQIEGQMTIEEVLAEYEKLEAEKEAENLADIETEDDVEDIQEEVNESEEQTLEDEEEESDDKTTKALESNQNIDINFEVKNHKIPEDYKGLFNDFVGTGSMEEKIADTLDNLINNFTLDGTSKTNNVIITGSAKIGKTTLGLSLIKAANRGRNRSGRKVAKVKASALNKRGVALAMTQILGTDLIIEQAGNLMPNTIVDLMIAMKNYTEEMLIVLEDDKAAIDRMLDNAPDLKGFFSNRLDIHEMEINDMVKIAKEYAEEQFYVIDDMGELALYAKLDDISGRNPVLSIEDIQEVIDDAVIHANRFRIGRLFGKMRRNKDEMKTLSEQDFL